jgi:hypothetical protein
MPFVKYEEYLKTAAWAEKRKAAKKRANYRCQTCGVSHRKINAHHNTYERLGDELPSDLLVLCEPCHRTFHGLPKPPSKKFKLTDVDDEDDENALPDWATMSDDEKISEAKELCAAVVKKSGFKSQTAACRALKLSSTSFSFFSRGERILTKKNQPGSYARIRHHLHCYLTTGKIPTTTPRRIQASFGYVKNEDGVLVENPEEQDAIRTMISLRDAGMTHRDIAKEMARRGVKIHQWTIAKLLLRQTDGYFSDLDKVRLKPENGNELGFKLPSPKPAPKVEKKDDDKKPSVTFIDPPKPVVQDLIAGSDKQEIFQIRTQLNETKAALEVSEQRLDDAARTVKNLTDRVDNMVPVLEALDALLVKQTATKKPWYRRWT